MKNKISAPENEKYHIRNEKKVHKRMKAKLRKEDKGNRMENRKEEIN